MRNKSIEGLVSLSLMLNPFVVHDDKWARLNSWGNTGHCPVFGKYRACTSEYLPREAASGLSPGTGRYEPFWNSTQLRHEVFGEWE